MTRTAKLLLAPVVPIQAFFFTWVALHRFIDGDEGHYLLASRLVLMHRRPYLDFFWNQAPLLPYVYALWMKCTTISWNSARIFSVLLTTLLGTLLYEHVCRQTRSWIAGVSAVVLYASSTLIFAWFTVAKTHSLAGLILFCAYLAVTRISVSQRWMAMTAGVLLGLSADTRSYLLLLIPVFLWWIYHNSDSVARLTSTLWFLGGFTIGVIPSLFFFLSSPDIFLFDNLRYHAMRSNQGLIGWWQQKLVVLLQLFLGGRDGNGLQWSILFLVSLGFLSFMPGRRYLPRLALQIALAIAVIGLLPTPSYLQYFCLCAPFLIVSAVCAVSEFFIRLESRRERLVAAAACVAVVGIYLAVSVTDFRKYLITGEGVPGVQPALDRGDWRLPRVIEVSQAVDQIAGPGETVASFWPGDIFQTSTDPLLGLENPFALPISDELTPQQRARYHIISPVEIESDFAAHRPRVVVLRNQILSALTPQDLLRMEDLRQMFIASLRAHGYNVVSSVGGISVYVCSSN